MEKNRMMRAVRGASLFLMVAVMVLGCVLPCFAEGEFTPPSNDDIGSSAEAEKKIWDYLDTALMWIQRIGLAVCVIAMIVGALIWATSGGNEGKVFKGRRAVTSALIGAAILIGALTIIKIMAGALGGQFRWTF